MEVKKVENCGILLKDFIPKMNNISKKHLMGLNEKIVYNKCHGIFIDGECEYLFFINEGEEMATCVSYSSDKIYSNKRIVAKAREIIYNFIEELEKPFFTCSHGAVEDKWIEFLGFKLFNEKEDGTRIYKWQQKQTTLGILQKAV